MTVIDKVTNINRNIYNSVRGEAYRLTWDIVEVNVAIKIVKHHTRGTVTTAVNKGADYITWKI